MQSQKKKSRNIYVFFCIISTDSFSEEEDEFIMAEDNAAADVEVGQGELRNLHIEGTQLRKCCQILLNFSQFRNFQMMIDMPMQKRNNGTKIRNTDI